MLKLGPAVRGPLCLAVIRRSQIRTRGRQADWLVGVAGRAVA